MTLIPQEILDNVTPKQFAFADEYVSNGCDSKRAAIATDCSPSTAGSWLKEKAYPDIAKLIQWKMQERERLSQLKSTYVRRYLYEVLENDLLAWFQPAEAMCDRGKWLISEKRLMELPHRIRKLIEEIEVTYKQIDMPDGTCITEKYMRVKLISKTTCLVTAAKYTLSQKLQIEGQFDVEFRALLEKVPEANVDETEKEVRAMVQKMLPPPTTGDNGHGKRNGTAGEK